MKFTQQKLIELARLLVSWNPDVNMSQVLTGLGASVTCVGSGLLANFGTYEIYLPFEQFIELEDN